MAVTPFGAAVVPLAEDAETPCPDVVAFGAAVAPPGLDSVPFGADVAPVVAAGDVVSGADAAPLGAPLAAGGEASGVDPASLVVGWSAQTMDRGDNETNATPSAKVETRRTA